MIAAPCRVFSHVMEKSDRKQSWSEGRLTIKLSRRTSGAPPRGAGLASVLRATVGRRSRAGRGTTFLCCGLVPPSKTDAKRPVGFSALLGGPVLFDYV